MTTRRKFLAGASAGIALSTLPTIAQAQTPLAMPPLLDATKTGRFDLTAQSGSTNFLGQAASNTWGFNQPYLGPTLRVSHKNEVQARIKNTLDEEISVHWHGALVPGDVDGGPHQTVAPGAQWNPTLPINQPAATLWYHSHIHGHTGRHVQMGLAGVMQLSDGLDDQRGLPSLYGVDDLTLVLQDRRFDRRGRAEYSIGMHEQMMGFAGDTMLVNGQENTLATVPRGVVRLRLLNGSNARIYALALSDGRPMHLVASEAGLLDQPIALKQMTLAPGERAEVLVDFTNGRDVTLVTILSSNTSMSGPGSKSGAIILPFTVDPTLKPRITKLAKSLGGSLPQLPGTGLTRREFTLNSAMGGGMMRMMGNSGNLHSINGAPFDMATINFDVILGATERWVVAGGMMMHPFHIHGVSFQVLSENGGPPRLQNRGWKDTVLVNGQAELLMRFDLPASRELPYMYHCHILEHEDGGMMGQFTVS
ncbi:MAG: multicopper oxidase domain-containing protein [Rhodobacteraceae bacterium]|nr:multicopper oxidase domain-containing protein [Paracoccaceae bacterium]